MAAPMGETAPLKVLGRYALHEVIAAGGMATVHYGRLVGPVGFARTVAIKRLHERLAQDPEFTSMFLDEARLAARIRHPNVVPTLDVVSADGEIFLVMEYVQGESLARLFTRERERRRHVPIPILTTILASSLHGLHAAHEATSENGEPLGIAHRDVSPQNILVGVDGVARVLDFGVAKAAGRASSTRDGQIKGKLSYMAPEQLRGGDVSRAVDIYAAGVVLWEGLVGRKLFQGDSEAETIALLLEGKVDPPSKLVPGISPELDTIVLKALSTRVGDRFATAREMARALEKAAPLVPASEVGEWVEEVAGGALQERSQKISAIERSSTSAIMALPAVVPMADRAADTSSVSLPAVRHDGPTASGVTESGRIHDPAVARPNTRYLVVWLLGFGLLALIGVIVGIAGLASRDTERRAVTATSASVSPAAPSPPPSVTAATVTAVTQPAALAAVPAESDPQGVPSATGTPTVSARPTSRPGTPTTPGATRPTSAPSCDPPYVVDANGSRRYKRECLR